MSEAEKQEGQKTVVAFITGLLIGGLLVWVFSSSPEKTTEDVTKDTNNTEQKVDGQTVSESKTETIKEAEKKPQMIGNGLLSVSEQIAGTSVTLGEITYPTVVGWIVVREFADGMPGNILGAARYNTEVGLLPKTVELQRETVAGGSYRASFYSENNDNNFELGVDTEITGGEAIFKVK